MWALWCTGAFTFFRNKSTSFSVKHFYDFEAKTIQGKSMVMDNYKGKTVLIVNTASQCGLTPQYEGLERLYQKYSDKGLVILGFPCNQFGQQEKGSEREIETFCSVNYGVSFPMFAKVDVNGSNAHPLFVFLKNSLGGILGNRIKWNFTKFVIDKEGRPIKRFAPITKPEEIEKFIKEII
ncbi:glutathione peroxidase [Flavobacterium sp. TSSA_36]|uniref:glutathione peroxidase n=1 Tax=Flavobacterium sp. TSSA_36 TaxID=3447669 RepID=UPI003F320BCC